MATLDVETIKEIPGFKVILKAVLRSQIQQLVQQLAEHTDEEAVMLTASVADGTLSHLGSENGKLYLDTHNDVKKSFLGFCLNRHHEMSAVGGPNQSKETSSVPGVKQNSSNHSTTTKIHSKQLSKSRHLPYQSGRPRSNSPSILKAGTSSVVAVQRSESEGSEKPSSQSNTGDEQCNTDSFMGVQIKQEPEDLYPDENCKSSIGNDANNKGNNSDKSVGFLSKNEHLVKVSRVNINPENNSQAADIAVDWSGYSDNMNESSGQWADNSDMMTNTTEQGGPGENFPGQNAIPVSLKAADGGDVPVFFESSRGGTKMSYNGFVYNQDRQGSERIYWRCQSRKCKGRLITNKSNGAVVREVWHNAHGPDYNSLDKIRKAMYIDGGWSCIPSE